MIVPPVETQRLPTSININAPFSSKSADVVILALLFKTILPNDAALACAILSTFAVELGPYSTISSLCSCWIVEAPVKVILPDIRIPSDGNNVAELISTLSTHIPAFASILV